MAYNPSKARKVCEGIALGRPLASVCKDRGMPSASEVYRWLVKRPGFRSDYLQAKYISSQSVAEQMLEIADGEEGPGGLPRDKVRIDARRQFLAQLPKSLAPLSEFDGLNLLPEDLEEIDFRE